MGRGEELGSSIQDEAQGKFLSSPASAQTGWGGGMAKTLRVTPQLGFPEVVRAIEGPLAVAKEGGVRPWSLARWGILAAGGLGNLELTLVWILLFRDEVRGKQAGREMADKTVHDSKQGCCSNIGLDALFDDGVRLSPPPIRPRH